MRDLVLSALDYLDPRDCEYQEWNMVGMALHAEGYPCTIWDEWSARDYARYHQGECERKWRTFGAGSSVVAGGSIVKLAVDNGFIYEKGHALEWDDEITDTTPDAETEEWNQCAELATYIRTIFEPDDMVSFCNQSKQDDDGKWKPYSWTVRKADDLLADLERYDDITNVIGSYNLEAGAWIRHNPNTKGSNSTTTAYRYVLIECDDLMVTEQLAMYKQLNLPAAAVVSSGGRSIHAIVHIDAKDEREYNQRVAEMFTYLQKNGLEIDKANKNSARLSRMPGVWRNGNRQKLLTVNQGPLSYDDWMAWRKEQAEPFEVYSLSMYNNEPLPEPNPELIEGVLREGHKMILTGDSKVGKTTILTELCAAITTGGKWLGMQCKKGNILYLNLEVDRKDFDIKAADICRKSGLSKIPEGFRIIPLRGSAEVLEKMLPRIIATVKKGEYAAIIIDPIYKVMGGDENSAEIIGKFCNQLDKIANATGCAVIYAHHHTKGGQIGKKASDRGSGSGVFGRDADAILDILDVAEYGSISGLEAYKESSTSKPLVMEFVLRSFADKPQLGMWFDYPLHIPDASGIIVHSINAKEKEQSQRGTPEQKEASIAMMLQNLESAYDMAEGLHPGIPHTIAEVSTIAGKTEKTVREWIKKSSTFHVKNSIVYKK